MFVGVETEERQMQNIGHGTATIVGLDPGLNGAFAILRDQELIACDDLPRFEKRLDPRSLVELLTAKGKPDVAVLELVSSMPGQGVSSTFNFGCSFGVCLGVIGALGMRLVLVTPSAWKRHFRIRGKPKDAARELALSFYPGAVSVLKRKKDHGRADAILLARYPLTAKLP